MTKHIELSFLHGWGCDAGVWRQWLPFVNSGVTYKTFDRGYFGTEKQNIILKQSAAVNVVIAHSFGLHFLSADSLPYIDLLVLISSFRRFHESAFENKIDRKRFDLMKQRLLIDPQAVLRDFYKKCGLNSPASIPTASINQQLLYDDLVLLENNCLDLDSLASVPSILLLHGSSDQIVSDRHSRLLNSVLPNSEIFIQEGGGHALPFTNRDWCMHMIETNKTNDKNIFFNFANSQPPSIIATNFGKRAETYNQAARIQAIVAGRLATRIETRLKNTSPGNILEIGCGTGFLSKHLDKLFPEDTIYFLDPAEEMLSICRTTLNNTALQKQGSKPASRNFIQSTLENYLHEDRFAQTKHGLIASSFVLHWLFDFKQAFSNLLQKLEPAGTMFFALPIAGSFPQWQSACRRLNIPFTANPLPDIDDIKSIAETNNATIDYEEYSCQIDYKTSLQFFQEMKLLGATTKKFTPVPNLTLTNFRSLLKTWDEESLASLGKDKGKVNCTYKILEGTITRR